MVPPGPDNPLGEYALYLGWPTYLIHGTNKPYGVGRRVSRGCIRMYPQGVERLYAEIPVGTPVTAVNQLSSSAGTWASSIRGAARFRADRRARGDPGHQRAAGAAGGSPADPGSRRAGRLPDRLGGGRGRADRAAVASRSRSPAPTRSRATRWPAAPTSGARAGRGRAGRPDQWHLLSRASPRVFPTYPQERPRRLIRVGIAAHPRGPGRLPWRPGLAANFVHWSTYAAAPRPDQPAMREAG